MSKLPVSASQISTFDDCKRKWALSKFSDVEVEENKYAAHGTATHKVLEDWMLKGTPLPDTAAGATAMPAIRLIPEPMRDDVDVEMWFSFDLEGVEATVRGRIDLAHEGEGGQPYVRDYKTTDTAMKYAKAPVDLADDTQFTLYAHAILEHICQTAEYVDLEWLYLGRVTPEQHAAGKGKPRARPVHLRVYRDPEETDSPALGQTTLAGLKPTLDRIKRSVQDMIDLYPTASADPMSAPINATACGKYGGCPYVATCNLSAKDALRSAMKQMGLKERLAARKAQGNSTDNVNPPPENGEAEAPREEEKVKTAPSKPAPSKPASKPTPNELRDLFASAACAGLLARGHITDPDAVAGEAFAVADAMMKAR